MLMNQTKGKVLPDGTIEGGAAMFLTNYCAQAQVKGKGLGGEPLLMSPSDATVIIETILLGLSDLAGALKEKENTIVVSIDDLKGHMLMGLKVGYEKGTKDNPEGSWEPSYIFDPAEAEGCTIYNISDTKFHEFIKNAATRRGFSFTNNGLIYAIILCFAECLIAALDANAQEGSSYTIEHPGFFIASVDVVDGKKVMSFIMEEEVSNIIKNDAMLAVEE